MPSHQENPNTGYITALGSAVFLSLTSIFISYLNVNFQLPALVLAFWREFFVALILLVVFFFSSEPCCMEQNRIFFIWAFMVLC